jgi:hypothetical protein
MEISINKAVILLMASFIFIKDYLLRIIHCNYNNMTTKLTRVIVTSLFATVFTVGVGFINTHSALADSTALGVTQITAIANSSGTVGYATADNKYADGWRWDFYVTVPNNQTLLKMKFADWVSGSNIIPAGGNIQIYSVQSTNAMDEAHAIPITASSTWSDIMNLNPNIDEDVSMGGRQIDIIVEAKIPTGSAGGSYSTSYGINTTATSSISFDGLTQIYNGTPEAVSITTTPANLPTTVTYSGTNYTSTTTAPTHVGTYIVNAVITDPGFTGTSTATLTINPESIAVVANPQSKVYDGATSTDPLLTYTVTPSIYSGDSFTGTTTRVQGENAGSYAITQGTLALDGDYALTFSPNNFVITQAPATVTLGNLEQTYDKTGKSVSATTSPVGLSTSVTYDGLATLPVNAGTHIVVATITDPNYTGSTTENLVIDPAFLTVTAITSTKVYDASTTSDGVPTITSGTIFTGDTAPAWTQTFDTKNVGTEKTLTATGTVADGNDGNNYHVTFDTATGSITPATAVVSATGQNKVYDGTTDASTTLSVSGTVGEDVLTAVDTAKFVSKDVADNIEVDVTGITISGPGVTSDDYTYNTTASTTADITAKDLTITANNATKTYGDEKTFVGTEFTSIGLAPTDTISSVTLTSDGVASTSAVGTYLITPSDPQGINMSDYTTPTYTNGNLTVTTAPITVAADSKTKIYGDSDPALTYQITSGSLFNGDTFSGSLNRTSGENVGSYPINQDSLTLGNNYALSFIPSSLTITASSSVVSLINLSQTYGNVTPVTATTNPTGLSYSVTYDGSAAEPTNAGTHTVVATITDPNYTGSTTDSLVISPLPITVTAATDTKTYDGTASSNGTPTITSGNQLVSPDSAVWTQTFDNKNVGTGKILTPAGIVSDNNGGANYDVTYATTTGSITSATATVSATGHNKVYDGTAVATVDLNVTGAVGSDVLTATPSKAIFVGSTPFNGKNIGTHPISVTGIVVTGPGVTSNDYTYNTSTSASATITAKALTATITAPDKTYDGTASSTITICTPVGVASGDSVQCTATNGTFSDMNVGTDKIVTADVNFTGAVSNYSLATTATTTASITPLNLTGTLIASDKTYDGTNIASTSCSLSGVINGDGVSCVTSSSVFSTRNAGTNQVTANLTLSGTDKDNYSVNPTANTTATISELPITVTAQANTKTYNGMTDATTLPAFTPALGSGDTASFIETYDNKDVGSGKTLTPSGTVTDSNSGNNYSYTFASSTNGVITAEPLTITATTNTKVYDGNTSAAAIPTVSGTIFSGDTPNFTETYDNATAGSDKILTPSGSVIDGTTGGTNYTYIYDTVSTGVINQATPTFTYNIIGSVSAGTDISAVISQTDAQYTLVPGVFSYNPQSGTVSSNSPLILQITFTPTDLTNYSTVTKTTTISVNN